MCEPHLGVMVFSRRHDRDSMKERMQYHLARFSFRAKDTSLSTIDSGSSAKKAVLQMWPYEIPGAAHALHPAAEADLGLTGDSSAYCHTLLIAFPGGTAQSNSENQTPAAMHEIYRFRLMAVPTAGVAALVFVGPREADYQILHLAAFSVVEVSGSVALSERDFSPP